MPRTNTTQFRVRYVECDAHGHVNNANYLRYMQEAARALAADLRVPPGRV
jgi:acyl-CoA thioesterase FadM